jgi:energy-converting hydrogenase B subunit M
MGGVYKNCYGDIPSEEIEGPVENIIPVNAKIPGCAVRPQDVLAGVVSLLPILLDAD